MVDIDALVQALDSGPLSGAAIDVFPKEPKSNTDTFISPLRGRDNVILTPHIGGSTQEAQHDIGLEVSSKLLKYSNNGSTLGAVNFPEVSLPAYPGQHRLLHIHRNQPGVLSEVNSVFSEKRINITGQFLQTNAKHRLRGDRHRSPRARRIHGAPQTPRSGGRHHPHPHPLLSA